jgi:hypothetical protein
MIRPRFGAKPLEVSLKNRQRGDTDRIIFDPIPKKV